MARYQRFLKNFSVSFVGIGLLIFLLVTWVDPFRNLGFPWAVSFVSDRNIAYKKFKLLETVDQVTDLVVGSSTSEVFVPQVLKERYSVRVFSASVGGASFPLRYLLVRQALKTHPELKRIVYIADLFEFHEPKLENTVAYQPEMMRLADPEIFKGFEPDWALRFNDYFSSLVIDRAFRTLKDMSLEGKGKYKSAYFADGSTTQSMIGGREGDSLTNRALASAVGMRSIYGKMDHLNENSKKGFQALVHLIENYSSPVELHIVISPFHEEFFRFYKKEFRKTGVYENWRTFLLDQRRPARVFVHDYSYPNYLKLGVTLADRHWQDGVHFTSEVMLKIVSEIFASSAKGHVR